MAGVLARRVFDTPSQNAAAAAPGARAARVSSGCARHRLRSCANPGRGSAWRPAAAEVLHRRLGEQPRRRRELPAAGADKPMRQQQRIARRGRVVRCGRFARGGGCSGDILCRLGGGGRAGGLCAAGAAAEPCAAIGARLAAAAEPSGSSANSPAARSALTADCGSNAKPRPQRTDWRIISALANTIGAALYGAPFV
ncbi:hypothetical protein SD70_23595, partial [Gordoniibacillus kamchatkensis]